MSSVLKQISPFQTSTDKIMRHSEHNSVLYSATKDSSLVSLHLLSQGCDASIITLSKRAGLERQKHSFRTLTVCMKWSALIRILPKWWYIFTKVTSKAPPCPLRPKLVDSVIKDHSGKKRRIQPSHDNTAVFFYPHQASCKDCKLQ